MVSGHGWNPESLMWYRKRNSFLVKLACKENQPERGWPLSTDKKSFRTSRCSHPNEPQTSTTSFSCTGRRSTRFSLLPFCQTASAFRLIYFSIPFSGTRFTALWFLRPWDALNSFDSHLPVCRQFLPPVLLFSFYFQAPLYILYTILYICQVCKPDGSSDFVLEKYFSEFFVAQTAFSGKRGNFAICGITLFFLDRSIC